MKLGVNLVEKGMLDITDNVISERVHILLDEKPSYSSDQSSTCSFQSSGTHSTRDQNDLDEIQEFPQALLRNAYDCEALNISGSNKDLTTDSYNQEKRELIQYHFSNTSRATENEYKQEQPLEGLSSVPTLKELEQESSPEEAKTVITTGKELFAYINPTIELDKISKKEIAPQSSTIMTNTSNIFQIIIGYMMGLVYLGGFVGIIVGFAFLFPPLNLLYIYLCVMSLCVWALLIPALWWIFFGS